MNRQEAIRLLLPEVERELWKHKDPYAEKDLMHIVEEWKAEVRSQAPETPQKSLIAHYREFPSAPRLEPWSGYMARVKKWYKDLADLMENLGE